jgi:ABC-type multidrug transport system ATPase subunit
MFHADMLEVRAVRGIDLHVDKGEVVAFIGPNGAGKSTTIKMLTGTFTRPRVTPTSWDSCPGATARDSPTG